MGDSILDITSNIEQQVIMDMMATIGPRAMLGMMQTYAEELASVGGLEPDVQSGLAMYIKAFAAATAIIDEYISTYVPRKDGD